MADDALFGPDGTQAPEPYPVLADPLGGLVSGDILAIVEPAPPIIVAPATIAPVTTATGGRQLRSPRRTTLGRPTQPRSVRAPAAPAAIPVAPGMSPGRSPMTPSVIGPAARVGSTPAAIRLAPARGAIRTGPVLGSSRAVPAIQQRRLPTGRGSSSVAWLVVVLILLVLVAVVVLGVLGGHSGGVGGG